MIRGLRPQQSGYTLIELIIVLSISIALVAGATALFSTRIPRAQFTGAMNDLQSRISSVANEVVSGYYPNRGNIACTSTGISIGSTEQGTNAECIFLGRVIQFGSNCSATGECDKASLYTMYGNRLNGSGELATQFSDAEPKLVYSDSDNILPEEFTLGYGTHIVAAKLGKGPSATDIGGIAFIQTFGTSVDVDGRPTGTNQVQLITFTNGFRQTPTIFAPLANSELTTGTLDINPPEGVLLCLESGTSRQFGTVTIGEGGRATDVNKQILSESEWESTCNL